MTDIGTCIFSDNAAVSALHFREIFLASHTTDRQPDLLLNWIANITDKNWFDLQ